ncbi:MAG: glycosyltransferase family 4 protein [Terrimicrobiaceae bacterium]
MKILVLNYEYPPVGGGGGRLTQKLCGSLAALGHDVRVLTAGMAHLPGRETMNGVLILRPQSLRRKEDTCSVMEMAQYLVTALPTALWEAWTWRPDVIHAHFVVPSGLLALAVKILAFRPYVVTAHLGDVPGGVPDQTSGLFRLAAPLAWLVWHQAAATTAVSSHVAGLASKAWGRAPEVILNGIPPILIPRPGRRTGPLKILMVGRLSVQKNPLLAMEALAKIANEPWQLDVIGDGPLADAMKTAAAQRGLTHKIQWSGWLEEADVRKKMETSDVLLMTSLQEGLPMAAVEALWHGLAIVGSRIGGLKDVIADKKNGTLCDLNPDAFAEALSRLIQYPETLLAMKHESQSLARHFDFAHCVASYEKTLRMAQSRQ